MDYQVVVSQIVIIFAIMMLGYLAARLGYITKEVKRGLTELLINIMIPATILLAFDTELPAAALNSGRIVLVFTIAAHLLTAILGMFLFRGHPDGSRVVLTFSTVFTNCAFIGYPLMESIFGTEGVFYTSIYSFVFTFFLWTFGQILFTGVKDFRTISRSLVNAATVSTLIGLAFLLTPLHMPPMATKIASLIGGSTTPLAMMVIGAMLAEVRLREMFRGWSVFFVTLMRLILLPLAAFAILPARPGLPS